MSRSCSSGVNLHDQGVVCAQPDTSEHWRTREGKGLPASVNGSRGEAAGSVSRRLAYRIGCDNGREVAEPAGYPAYPGGHPAFLLRWSGGPPRRQIRPTPRPMSGQAHPYTFGDDHPLDLERLGNGCRRRWPDEGKWSSSRPSCSQQAGRRAASNRQSRRYGACWLRLFQPGPSLRSAGGSSSDRSSGGAP